MIKAIAMARKAFKIKDVPVGAVIVENSKIIASAYNNKHLKNDPTAHAEMLAIRKACKKKKTTYLNNCTMYVTLEPCGMCTSAIMQAHIKKVIFSVKSPKYGELIGKNIEYEQMYDEEYERLIKDFFKDKR